MEEESEDAKMPLLDHLVELRQRLIYSVGGFLLCFLCAFYFAGDIFNFLVQPLADLWQGEEARRLIFTALHEKFITEIKVAFFAGAFLAFPVIAIQMWMFIAPGLYKYEKQAFMPFLVATPSLPAIATSDTGVNPFPEAAPMQPAAAATDAGANPFPEAAPEQRTAAAATRRSFLLAVL